MAAPASRASSNPETVPPPSIPVRLTVHGVKGVGEIGVVGVAAAIANAIYHATGRRVRDLPITLEKLRRVGRRRPQIWR
jgi:CO/xanthine dehydrogenase Mo-binding subunit